MRLTLLQVASETLNFTRVSLPKKNVSAYCNLLKVTVFLHRCWIIFLVTGVIISTSNSLTVQWDARFRDHTLLHLPPPLPRPASFRDRLASRRTTTLPRSPPMITSHHHPRITIGRSSPPADSAPIGGSEVTPSLPSPSPNRLSCKAARYNSQPASLLVSYGAPTAGHIPVPTRLERLG